MMKLTLITSIFSILLFITLSKHPVLYGVFIPDNSSLDIIYINKKSFTIARRRNADYVVYIIFLSSLDD